MSGNHLIVYVVQINDLQDKLNQDNNRDQRALDQANDVMDQLSDIVDVINDVRCLIYSSLSLPL